MKEERKQSMTHFATQGVGALDLAEQEKRYKARINNNSQFIRTQNQVFSNISSVDKLIAYSLHQNCMPIARVKHQQVLSLVTKFNTANTQDQKVEGKKIFSDIIRNRFHAEQQPENDGGDEDQVEYDMDEEDEEDEEDASSLEEQQIEGNIRENQQRSRRPPDRHSSSSDFSDAEQDEEISQNDEEEI